MVESLFQTTVDGVTASDWNNLFALFEDANPYQTWSYGSIRWGEKNLSHLVLRREGHIKAIAQLRIVRTPFIGGGVAYLRWGPLCQLRGADLNPEIVREAHLALYEEFVRKRKLFLRIVPDAFAGSTRSEMLQTAFSKCTGKTIKGTTADRTFVLDLAPSLEELRSKLDGKWRNQLNRAEKNNLTIVEGSSAAEYQAFTKIYEEMWSRKKFDTTVDVHEFGRINEALPAGQKFKVLICQKEGVPICGIVCSAVGNTGIYLLGATNDHGLESKGAYLLQWAMIKWLKENGFRSYDLGGIDPELNPGVYHFKRGFSAQDVFRIGPLEACEGMASSLFMKAADFAREDATEVARKFKKEFLATASRFRPQSKPIEVGKVNN
ncbi:MAG: peptidoglycan bridge formation glycyltransferase FemA/FemB family protein [Verrucomicrobiota bacterium]